VATTPSNLVPVPANLQNPFFAQCDDKERAFVLEYPVDWNAIRACERAGYGRNKTNLAYEILRRPHVVYALLHNLSIRAEINNIQHHRLLEELAVVAFSNIAHYNIDDYGNVVLMAGAPDTAMRAVAKIKKRIRHEKKEDGTDVTIYETELALWNKVEAINMAMKHLGMFLRDKLSPTNVEDILRALNNGPVAEG